MGLKSTLSQVAFYYSAASGRLAVLHLAWIGEFERIDGTGENGDNGEIAIVLALFSLSTLFSSVAKEPFMHPLFAQASGLTHDVIGAAIEVHKDKGPGLLESIYEWCLMMELELRGHSVQNQDQVVVRYKHFQRQYLLRFDLLVGRCLFVEVKATDDVHPINKAQLLSYMKLMDIPLGLIINFNELKLTDGVSRLILPGANLE